MVVGLLSVVVWFPDLGFLGLGILGFVLYV